MYLSIATVWYYLRVHYYSLTYKQLYIISFLFFNNLAIVSRMTLLQLQAIMLPNNAPVHNRVYIYLRLLFISMYVSYIFNILLAIFPLYFLLQLEYNWWHYHPYTIIYHNPGLAKWHVALFEGALLMKITTTSMFFVFK